MDRPGDQLIDAQRGARLQDGSWYDRRAGGFGGRSMKIFWWDIGTAEFQHLQNRFAPFLERKNLKVHFASISPWKICFTGGC